MIQQLDPPIPLFVPGRGCGVAHLVIDYGPEFDLMWVVAMDMGGEIWTLPNPQVRATFNATMGRTAGLPEYEA
jgi:hypothetical protein